MIETKHDPTVPITFLSKAVGKISTGLEEDFILGTRSVRSFWETGLKYSKIGGREGQAEMGVVKGMMLALISLILSTKKERNLLQSGGAGFTMLSIVLNRTFGFHLLKEINFEK